VSSVNSFSLLEDRSATNDKLPRFFSRDLQLMKIFVLFDF
jgi:hypothetical protein